MYQTLICLLKSSLTVPVKERDEQTYYYYYNYSKQLSVSTKYHPVIGPKAEERVMFTSSDGKQSILVKCDEKERCIEFFYRRTKGDCARKLKKRIDEVFTGISESDIQLYINTSKQNQLVKAVFENGPPLKPVTASKVW